jgi:arylsulfatase
VRVRFDKTGDLAGRASLSIGDKLVGSGSIDHTYGGMFALEGLDVGQDSKTAVSDLYRAPFPFRGVIHRVDVELDDDQSDPDA